MGEEVVVASSNDVKFIEGVTQLTQNNWMSYFGNVIPSGVAKGLGVRTFQIYDGVVAANGIVAKLETEDGYTPYQVPGYADGYNDTFICARVYLLEGRMEIVLKQLSDSYDLQTITTTEKNLIADESYGCVRNNEIYEIPLYYRSDIFTYINPSSSTNYYEGRSLRRWGDKYYEPSYSQADYRPIRVSKDRTVYNLGNLKDTNVDRINVAIDFMNPPEICYFRVTGNYTRDTEVNLLHQKWADGLYKPYMQQYLDEVSIYTSSSGWTNKNVYLEANDRSSSPHFTVSAFSKTISQNNVTPLNFRLTMRQQSSNPRIEYDLEEI